MLPGNSFALLIFNYCTAGQKNISYSLLSIPLKTVITQQCRAPQQSHIAGVVERVVFALSEGPPAVVELLAHAGDHLTEDLPSGSSQFNLLQFQKVQGCRKKLLRKQREVAHVVG